MYHPPSSFALTDSLGPERLWSNIHSRDVVAYLRLSAALLDFCKGDSAGQCGQSRQG
jgi:hypothetical protein